MSRGAYLDFVRLQSTTLRCRYTMVSVDQEQLLSGIEDDDGRQGFEYFSVPLYPSGVEVRLGIDRCADE